MVELHLLKECIRMVWIKHLITSHDSNQIFSIRQIDDIMCPAGDHVNCFNLVAADLKFEHLVTADTVLLNESVSRHDNEKFPF